MITLEKLVHKCCPNGVKFVKLSTVCDFITGFAFKSNSFTKQGSPICKTTNIKNDKVIFNDMTCFSLDDYDEDLSKFLIKQNDIVIGMSGTIKVGINLENKSCYLNQRVGKFIPNQNKILSKFLYYLLLEGVPHLSKDICGGSVKNLSNKDVENFVLPLPPIEIQKQIVEILDRFTRMEAEMEAELEAELVLRKQQYEYYRDKLVWNHKYKTSTLKDIAITKMYRGVGIKRTDLSNSGVPCIRYGEIYTTYGLYFYNCVSHTNLICNNTKYANKGDILFAITGERVDEIGKNTVYLGDKKIAVGGDIVVLHHKQDPLYISFALMTHKSIEQKSHGKIKSKVVHTSVPSLEQILIPIPDVVTQKKISTILFMMNEYIESIYVGLQKEIVLRHKQYEYYRSKILTFVRKDS